MKVNKIERPNRGGLALTAVIVLLVILGLGAVLGYEKLKGIYLEQCVITDMPSQVKISSGKMVHPSTIAEELGLRTGANLALIDFTAKREELLAKIPNLRRIRIERHLPDKVIVTAEDRAKPEDDEEDEDGRHDEATPVRTFDLVGFHRS